MTLILVLSLDDLKHICLKGFHILQIIKYSVALMLTVRVLSVEDADV